MMLVRISMYFRHPTDNPRWLRHGYRGTWLCRERRQAPLPKLGKVASMKAITVLALATLLGMTAACRNESAEDRPDVPAFMMMQCSPVDPHCQLAMPPHLADRPGPGAL
jgi:hypothetical protein